MDKLFLYFSILHFLPTQKVTNTTFLLYLIFFFFFHPSSQSSISFRFQRSQQTFPSFLPSSHRFSLLFNQRTNLSFLRFLFLFLLLNPPCSLFNFHSYPGDPISSFFPSPFQLVFHLLSFVSLQPSMIFYLTLISTPSLILTKQTAPSIHYNFCLSSSCHLPPHSHSCISPFLPCKSLLCSFLPFIYFSLFLHLLSHFFSIQATHFFLVLPLSSSCHISLYHLSFTFHSLPYNSLPLSCFLSIFFTFLFCHIF